MPMRLLAWPDRRPDRDARRFTRAGWTVLVAVLALVAGCARATSPTAALPSPTHVAALPNVPNAASPLPSPLLGVQPTADPGLIEVPLQVPSDLALGVFAVPQKLLLRPGFHIGVFAAGLSQARGLTISPAGD